MTRGFVASSALALLLAACTSASSYDSAWAECEEEAEEIEDYDELSLEDRDLQRREYVRECMEEKGLVMTIEEEDDDDDVDDDDDDDDDGY